MRKAKSHQILFGGFMLIDINIYFTISYKV